MISAALISNFTESKDCKVASMFLLLCTQGQKTLIQEKIFGWTPLSTTSTLSWNEAAATMQPEWKKIYELKQLKGSTEGACSSSAGCGKEAGGALRVTDELAAAGSGMANYCPEAKCRLLSSSVRPIELEKVTLITN